MAYGSENRKQSGTITSTNSTVDISMPAAGTVAVQVSGTFAGTIQFQGCTLEGTFLAIPATRVTTSTLTAFSFALTGTPAEIYKIDAAGLITVRVACTVYTSGTLTVNAVSSHAESSASSGAIGTGLIGIDSAGTVTYYPNVVTKSEVLLARAAYTSTQTITPITNYGFNALEILIRVHTAPGGGETLTWGLNQILAIGNTPTATTAITTTQAITTAGLHRQYFAPYSQAAGASGDPGAAAAPKIVIPPVFNLLITHSAAGSWNYEVLAYWNRI